ncbi:reduced folate transporter isoform X2 [Delphinapterus leucas]|uniref:Reduced folate transporter n=1 Tax=Delphinapterus leucas TaxID=9749 RepID=A0A2Y9QBD8_DELLE|nr:reduced folate transporter isoform X2 [Delphinapterus leucas]XP_022452802.1 reduced folate transporter isoform X2 [Delphinapterus leucas]XP_022452804.1 reduced folate transporter isoform X2 [Delphinapterus leucas]XP_030616774.1 reduced folate transporter isoform X2 [Delphinapterus leucas]XP_030616775.1 reduced folate transporter isoform X2 [Delphinapterus leucas]
MALSGPEVEKQVPAEPRRGRKLQSWWSLVFCLCFYGFMAQMRPGESFITPYLLGPDKNFTQKQVTNEITPVLSYSYLAVLVPIFLLTDYLRYKPVLLLQGLSYVSVWLLLLFGSSVLHMQFMEFFFSITMAARIAYSSYIFSLVPSACYQRMAGYSRASVLLGVFTSSVLGQLLVTMGRVPFSTLNYISLAFLTFSLVLTLFLKRPERSLFFNRGAPASAGASPSELDRMNLGQGQPTGGKLGRLPASWRDSVLVYMLRELGRTAQLPQLRLWSLWWVFNSAGYYLIVYYVHILWNVVNPTTDTTRVYNGGADAASTLLGAITSFAAGFVKIRWALWAELIIAVVTVLQAGLVFLMYRTSSIWLCYLAFVLFRGSYQFLVPIATFQIASSLSQELRALVFGVNTFLATVLKTIITLVVSDKRGLGLPVRSQFLIYFVYFLVLFVAYVLAALLTGLRHFRQGRRQPPPPARELTSPMQEPDAQDRLAPEDGVRAMGEQRQQPEAKA